MIEYILARPFIALFCISAFIYSIVIYLFDIGYRISEISIFSITVLLVVLILFRRSAFAKLLLLIVLVLICNIILHLDIIHLKFEIDNHNSAPAQTNVIVDKSTRINDDIVITGRLSQKYKSSLVRLKFPYTVEGHPLFYGDTVKSIMELIPVVASNSSYFLGFNTYLLNQHIYYQARIIDSEVQVSKNSKFTILRYSQYLAYKFENIIHTQIPNKEIAHLMTALLLGTKSSLDKSIKNNFTLSGTAHILAVSGLHLGMIYAIILLFIKYINKMIRLPNKKLISFIIIVFCIWSFVFISGSSTSVIRAAIMISYIETGRYLSRNTNSINSLFCCAFLMIFYNPCTMFEIGFQLSFFAVLSILLYNPYISRFYFTKNKYGKYLNDLISISLAAQILVTPISIFYFHQFPVYFILGNLLWIPLSFILLNLGIGMILLSSLLPIASLFIGKLCIYLSNIGLVGLEYIKLLPFTVMEGLWVDKSQIAIYIGSCILIFFWIKIKKNILLILSLCLILTIPIIQLFKQYKINKSSELLIYAEKSKIHLDIRNKQILYTTNPHSKIMNNYRSAKSITTICQITNLNDLKAIIPLPELTTINGSFCNLIKLEKIPSYRPIYIFDSNWIKSKEAIFSVFIIQSNIKGMISDTCFISVEKSTIYDLTKNGPLTIKL